MDQTMGHTQHSILKAKNRCIPIQQVALYFAPICHQPTATYSRRNAALCAPMLGVQIVIIIMKHVMLMPVKSNRFTHIQETHVVL